MLNGNQQLQRVILVGGTSEIGLAIVRNLPLASDAEVVSFQRSKLSNNFSQNHTYQIREIYFDLEDFPACLDIFNEIISEADFDLVIFAAGYLGNSKVYGSERGMSSVLKVNYFSTAHLLSSAVQQAIKQRHGKIAIISSFATVRARLSNFVYGSSKSGIDFLAQGFQLQLRDSGANLTILRPGFVKSRMTEGLNPAPFAISVAKAGSLGAAAIMKSKKTAYLPSPLRLIAILFKVLPCRLVARMDLGQSKLPTQS